MPAKIPRRTYLLTDRAGARAPLLVRGPRHPRLSTLCRRFLQAAGLPRHAPDLEEWSAVQEYLEAVAALHRALCADSHPLERDGLLGCFACWLVRTQGFHPLTYRSFPLQTFAGF